MTTSAPTLDTQVIGRAESALGAILDPILARADLTFHEWLVFVTSSANPSSADGPARQEQVVARITDARKVAESDVLAAIVRLAGAGFIELGQPSSPDGGPTIRLAPDGAARFGQVRSEVREVMARLFAGLPEQDLATAGRVLSVVTERANAEIVRLQR
jgi:DNA-binding MarR family transcriptional regulator